MQYKTYYKSPLGKLTLISDEKYLTHILFENDRFYSNLDGTLKDDLKIFKETKHWLDEYFKGKNPKMNLKLKPDGTPFRKKVWNILLNIPYGKTITYSEIAKKTNTSSRAIGGAVAHNPIPIIIPCHRVVGIKGLTGYSGGMDKKIKLLEIERKRCSWCNLKNELYIKYHDDEWGEPVHNDKTLFELLILESFQAGLSWECILNKREAFRKAYDNFDINKVVKYDENKINELINNKNIVRNKLKIKASIKNAKIFKEIQNEYKTFDNYIWSFTNKTIYEKHKTSSKLSDKISKDLKKRGMSFVGTTIIYSYLEAIGIINTHEKDCYKSKVFSHNKCERDE